MVFQLLVHRLGPVCQKSQTQQEISGGLVVENHCSRSSIVRPTQIKPQGDTNTTSHPPELAVLQKTDNIKWWRGCRVNVWLVFIAALICNIHKPNAQNNQRMDGQGAQSYSGILLNDDNKLVSHPPSTGESNLKTTLLGQKPRQKIVL